MIVRNNGMIVDLLFYKEDFCAFWKIKVLNEILYVLSEWKSTTD